ncbi:MAG: hypothetical protein JW797_03980 [Bradymonadales bacterium]|nr:hypothetical protein [Bradymonadales bacterium]
MKYRFKIGDSQRAVQIDPPDKERLTQVTVEGQPQPIAVEPLSPGEWAASLPASKVCHLVTASSPEGTWVWADGQAFLVEEPQARRTTRGPGAAPKLAVTPPMPAVVVEVLVAPGQRVERGQALVVVSAMKMEMTLSAPKGGQVRALNTKEGASVSPGEILVEIDYDRQEASHE